MCVCLVPMNKFHAITPPLFLLEMFLVSFTNSQTDCESIQIRVSSLCSCKFIFCANDE